MTDEEKLNRSLGQKGRWIKEELSQMAEGAMVRVDVILGLRKAPTVSSPWWGGMDFTQMAAMTYRTHMNELADNISKHNPLYRRLLDKQASRSKSEQGLADFDRLPF
jgi:hypothetical protein